MSTDPVVIQPFDGRSVCLFCGSAEGAEPYMRAAHDFGVATAKAGWRLVYGGGGDMDWQILDEDHKVGLRLTFRDEGPGIPDIKLAMTDGWTSGSGMGLGLTGAKRLVEEFELDTEPGKGTRITITRWT